MASVTSYMNYTTQAGDTFDLLALAFYSEEKLASYIINENKRYADVIVFDEGISLRIPVLEDTAERPDTLPPWRR